MLKFVRFVNINTRWLVGFTKIAGGGGEVFISVYTGKKVVFCKILWNRICFQEVFQELLDSIVDAVILPRWVDQAAINS